MVVVCKFPNVDFLLLCAFLTDLKFIGMFITYKCES